MLVCSSPPTGVHDIPSLPAVDGVICWRTEQVAVSELPSPAATGICSLGSLEDYEVAEPVAAKEL